MGITYRIDPIVGSAFVLFDGVVTDEDFIVHTELLMADPDWPPRRKLHLTDVTTQHDPGQLSAATITRMAELWGAREDQLTGMKIAVVAADGFGNAEVFERTAVAAGLSMIIFNTLSTACVWLGIDAAGAEQVFREIRASARSA